MKLDTESQIIDYILQIYPEFSCQAQLIFVDFNTYIFPFNLSKIYGSKAFTIYNSKNKQSHLYINKATWDRDRKYCSINTGKKSTILHETGHVALGHNLVFSENRNPSVQEADTFLWSLKKAKKLKEHLVYNYNILMLFFWLESGIEQYEIAAKMLFASEIFEVRKYHKDQWHKYKPMIMESFQKKNSV